MERWVGRVAVVTGASSGIGAGIAKELVKQGLTVVGIARRVDRIQDLSKQLHEEKGKLHALKANLRNETETLAAFDWIEKNTDGIDVLVNNAGIARFESLLDGSTEAWKEMVELHLIGLSVCSREAVRSMKKKGADDGIVINISSVLGHSVTSSELSIYSASKRAILGLSESLHKELKASGSPIRVTNLSPGLVETEILSNPDFKWPLDYKAPAFFQSKNVLQPSDIAQAVVFVMSVDSRVHIPQLTVQQNFEFNMDECRSQNKL